MATMQIVSNGARGRAKLALSFALSLPLTACGVLIPDLRTPADRARDMEPKCRQVDEEAVAPLLSPDAVDSVEPSYSYVPGGLNGHELHLRGARISIRPQRGLLTRETIARALECHEARVVLGRAPVQADDPYVLPARWLGVDVESEGDAFVVVLHTDEFDDAKKVLERAKAFAAERSEHGMRGEHGKP